MKTTRIHVHKTVKLLIAVLPVSIVAFTFENCSSGFDANQNTASSSATASLTMCTSGGISYAPGQTVSSFLSSAATYPNLCATVNRTCQASGVFDGPILNACTQSCVFPGDGVAVAAGSTAYYTASSGAMCTPIAAVCEQSTGLFNVTLPATAVSACTVKDQTCSYTNGSGIAIPTGYSLGSTVVGYTSANETYPNICKSVTSVCQAPVSPSTTGLWNNGSPLYSSCTQSCSLNGSAIAQGTYHTFSVGTPAQCAPTTVCGPNGQFSPAVTGTNVYSQCTSVAAPLINSFTATSKSVISGSNTTLNWSVSSASGFPATIAINGATVTGTSFTTPALTVATTFVLTASNTVNGVTQTSTSSLNITIASTTPTPTPTTSSPPASGLPGAPTLFSASGIGGVSGVYPAMNGAYVLFSPPSNAASLSASGAPIQSYIATAYNSSGAPVATATSVLNTLVNAVSARVDFRGSLPSSGGPYTIKVAATNSNGTGPQSAASEPVTPNVYADYYLYSGTASGLSSAWGDYNGSVNMLSTNYVYSEEHNSMMITGGTGNPWFIGYWINPLAGGGYAGMFDLGPYKYVVMKVYPVDQATANAINVGFAYEEFIFGVCGTGSSGGTCVDPTQDFTAGSLLTGGGLGNSPRIATVNPKLSYNSVSANTATSISSGGGQSFSAGTPYLWSVQDVRSIPLTIPLTTAYGTLTPGVWNQIKIPITDLDSGPNMAVSHSTNTVHEGYTQEIGISLSNGATAVYITDVGFTAN